MRILRLILINRKRLSGYTKIDIDLSDEKHLILGDNGSGKTNFLSELSALPPDPKDYGPEGQKSIWFELDDGKIIEFTSYPNQKKLHEVFINDDKENNINISGTVTEQKELAKKYTGITKEFFDLLILGDEKFTESKPVYRRELFNKINPTNFDFALKLYQKLRDGYKANQAVIKHLSKHLSILETKKINDEEIEAMESRLRMIDDELSVWLDLKLKNLRKPSSIKKDIHDITVEYRNHIKRLSKRFDKLEDHLDNSTAVKEEIAGTTAELKAVRSQMGELSTALESKKKSIYFDSTKRQTALIEIKRLNEEIDKIGNGYYEKLLATAELHTKSYYDNYFTKLNMALSQVPKDFDRDVYNNVDYIEKIDLVRKDIVNNKNVLTELNKATAHYEKHIKSNKVCCPSCSYEFIPFLKIENITDIKKCIAETEVLLWELETEEENLVHKQNELELDHNKLREFISVVKSDPVVSECWHNYLSEDLTRTDEFYTLAAEIYRSLDKRELYLKKEAIEKELLIHKEYDANREQIVKNEITTINEQLNQLHQKLVHLTERNNELNNYLKELSRRIADIEEIENALIKIDALSKELDTSTTNEFIEVHVGELTTRRAELYMAAETARNNLRDRLNAKKEIEEKEKELLRLATLIKAMSPVDGIIAEGMTNFVNRFIEDTNKIIKHNWEDRLVIKPCKMDMGAVELDYLFPVETHYETPPDVSLCSKGQREIIDLAFREVAMKYMQLATHPILFDEWSVNMDDLHRQKACELLSTFTDVSMHSQIIVASHLKSVHDALGIVKRFVLSSKNITVNGEYNTHVKMHR